MSKKKSSRTSSSPSIFDQALNFVPKDMRKQVVKYTTEALKQTEKQRKVLEKDLRQSEQAGAAACQAVRRHPQDGDRLRDRLGATGRLVGGLRGAGKDPDRNRDQADRDP